MDLLPLTEAAKKISAKTPVGSVLRSAQWEKVPLAMRERAQFSSGVESLRVLQTVQDRLEGALKLEQERLANGKRADFDRGSFINAVRDIARAEGLTPTDPQLRGGLQDITSIPRLGLIHDMQVAQAQEFARWKMDQTDGALLLYPAQEFLRVESRRLPREDWPERWARACNDAGDHRALAAYQATGRMVALKTSQVWEQLSRFDTPWPPFDFNSGMGLEDLDRDTAVELNLMDPSDRPEPMEAEFNDRLEASAQGLDPRLLGLFKHAFGRAVQIMGDAIRWAAGA